MPQVSCEVPLDKGQRSLSHFAKVGTCNLSYVAFGKKGISSFANQREQSPAFGHQAASSLNVSPDTCCFFVLVALYRSSRTDSGGLQRQAYSASWLADPAIRQIIWCLADTGGYLPVKRRLYWPGKGGPGWKCVFAAPCCFWLDVAPLKSSLRPRAHSERWPAAVLAIWSLTWGLVCPRALRPLFPTQPTQNRCPGPWPASLVGSCKPPVCSGLHSYGGPAVMARASIKDMQMVTGRHPVGDGFCKCLTM